MADTSLCSAPGPDMISLSSFNLFAKLPSELRFEIWRLAIAADQRVIRYTFGCSTSEFTILRRTTYNICSEAREEYLQFYNSIDVEVPQKSTLRIQWPYSMSKMPYLDFERDIIVVDLLNMTSLTSRHPPHFTQHLMSNVQILAIDQVILHGVYGHYLELLGIWGPLRMFTALKELRLGRIHIATYLVQYTPPFNVLTPWRRLLFPEERDWVQAATQDIISTRLRWFATVSGAEYPEDSDLPIVRLGI